MMSEIIEAIVTKKVKLIFANNPKVGDRVWSFRGGRKDLEPNEHILTEKTSEELFKSTKYSCIHISNIYYEV